MKKCDIKRYGPHMNIAGGGIAEVGLGKYKHRFGGDTWAVIDDEKIGGGPTLLMTLDLADPRLEVLRMAQLEELPLCCYLNCIGIGKQEYSIRAQERRIVLLAKDMDKPEVVAPEFALPRPLPEKNLILRDRKPTENPVDEDTYWACCDEFLGGRGVIRILGAPVWLQWVEDCQCTCGKQMRYVGSVGYEVDNPYRQLLDAMPFFPGEMAHYFFLCKSCCRVVVLLQPT